MSVLDDPRESKSWRLCLSRWRELTGTAARVRRTTAPEAFAAWAHVVGERPLLVTQRLLEWDRATGPGRTLLGPPTLPAASPPPPVRWWPPAMRDIVQPVTRPATRPPVGPPPPPAPPPKG